MPFIGEAGGCLDSLAKITLAQSERYPCGVAAGAMLHRSFPAYGVGSQVSVSMFTRVALIVPLITGPADVLPSGIKLVIVNLPV